MTAPRLIAVLIALILGITTGGSKAGETARGEYKILGWETLYFPGEHRDQIVMIRAAELQLSGQPRDAHLSTFGRMSTIDGEVFLSADWIGAEKRMEVEYPITPALARVLKLGKKGAFSGFCDAGGRSFVYRDGDVPKDIFVIDLFLGAEASFIQSVTPIPRNGRIAVIYTVKGQSGSRLAVIEIEGKKVVSDSAINGNFIGVMEELDWVADDVLLSRWQGRKVGGCQLIEAKAAQISRTKVGFYSWMQAGTVFSVPEPDEHTKLSLSDQREQIFPAAK